MKRDSFIIGLLIIIASTLWSQEPNSKKVDLASVHSYIDSLALAEMDNAHIPGSVIVVIQDSSEVYIKGFGFADVENQVSVDPTLTGFRIASVTKTFTATAVMQLVEKGLINVHTPISNYLPDDNFSFLKDEPMTVHQLLTHTAGIDLTDIGDAALTPDKVIDLESLARYHIPDQVHPPGQVHSYSNFGYALLGYLIQAVSGQTYETYMDENILRPLGMVSSSFLQPLPAPFADNLSKSYTWQNGYEAIPRDFTNTVPGGGLITSGNDMAHYMLMHLNAGSWDSTQIFHSNSHNVLTSQQYGSEGTSYGVCYAFFENGWTGRRSLDHSGAQLGFLSLMVLIPETGTGVFIAQNTREKAGAFRYNLTRAILDTLLQRKPREINLPGPSDELRTIASNYTGRYQQMNYPHSSFEKLGTLFGFYNSAYKVRYHKDGFLTLNGDQYSMINERVFHVNDTLSPWNISFELDDAGRAQRIIAGTLSYVRTPWYHNKKFWQRFMAFSLALLFIHVLQKSIRWSYRKIKKQGASETSDLYTKWLYLTGLLLVLGIAGIFLNLALYRGQLADYGVPLGLKLALAINTLGALLTLYAPIAIFRTWRVKKHPVIVKLWASIVMLSLLSTTIGLAYHNVIGFQF